MAWWKERSLVAAAIVGAMLRISLWLAWPDRACLRDECTYLQLAGRIADGHGMGFSNGWLWAPGYPALLAAHEALAGLATHIRATQIFVAFATTWLIWWLTWRIGRDTAGRSETTSRRAASIAAWLFACNPSGIFFSVSLWSEAIYSSILLLAVAAFFVCSRSNTASGRSAALLTGVALGICVLFRGVATYLLPVFAGAILLARRGHPDAWPRTALAVLAAVVTVAPYSAYISSRIGAFTISDRTLGRMMYLGNNDFAPVSFDYGGGLIARKKLAAHLDTGRPPCAPLREGLRLSRCSTREGFAWIAANPGTFALRIPERVAQLLNPHSFLTRHLRLRLGLRPLPGPIGEVAIAAGAALSMLLIFGGVLGLAAYGRGATGALVTGVLLYHVAVIAALAGLTRYRVPLEPLLTIYAALALADRSGLREALGKPRWRGLVAAGAIALLLPLVLWHLPDGWPAWKGW